MAVVSLTQFAKGLVSQISKGPAGMVRALEQALKDAARQAHKDAVANAPRSPTAAQARAQRKASWVAKHGDGKASIRAFNRAQRAGKGRRKAGSHSRHAPGGLERSIEWEVRGKGFAMEAEIFVAANAEAGKYAKRIHDEKGKTWRKRGPGTVAKGARADDKFVSRAAEKAVREFPERLRKWLGRLR